MFCSLLLVLSPGRVCNTHCVLEIGRPRTGCWKVLEMYLTTCFYFSTIGSISSECRHTNQFQIPHTVAISRTIIGKMLEADPQRYFSTKSDARRHFVTFSSILWHCQQLTTSCPTTDITTLLTFNLGNNWTQGEFLDKMCSSNSIGNSIGHIWITPHKLRSSSVISRELRNHAWR